MPRKARQIGRDRVELDGDVLTITTPVRTMAGWDVRRYRAPIIRFDGRTWRITEKTVGADTLTRYRLEAWEPLAGEITGPEIQYTPEDVALRDFMIETGRRRSRITMALNFVSPLTGFLPARTKARLETVYGIDPVASSRASVLLEFPVTLGGFALASIAQIVRAYGFDSGISISLCLIVAIIAGIDGLMRWSEIHEEVRPVSGFLEWIFRRRSR